MEKSFFDVLKQYIEFLLGIDEWNGYNKKGRKYLPIRPFQSAKLFLLSCSPAELKSASLDMTKLSILKILHNPTHQKRKLY